MSITSGQVYEQDKSGIPTYIINLEKRKDRALRSSFLALRAKRNRPKGAQRS